MSKLQILLIVLCLYGAYNGWNHREFRQAPGVLVNEEPLQLPIPEGVKSSALYNGTVIDFLASYKIKARILSRERYWIDRGAKYSPIDFALGWGPMSDSSNIEKLKISQNDRFYFFSYKSEDYPDPTKITLNSANTHIIPSNPDVKDQVLKLRVGQVVTLTGYLVRVNHPDGSDWKSSLTRSDTGNGACEILWVTKVDLSTTVSP